MAVGNILRLAGPFTGSGTTSLPFGFKVFYPTDVYVAVANNDTETPSNLTYGTNYSVVINDDQDATPGGTVTLITPLEVNQIAVVGSSIPYTQETQMTNYNRFPPGIINTALDRIVIQIQQLVEQLGRVVKVPETSSSTPEQLISNLFTARNEAVEASQKAEASATTSKTYAEKVLAFKSAIEAVSNYLTEVQTVAEKIDDVATVSADMDNVRTVAGDHNAINSLIQNIKYVRAVSDIVDNVVTVATNVTSVQLAAAHREQIDIVAGGIASVKTVADDIDSVTALANKLAELVTIVSHLAAVDTVSADIASVVKVADGIKEVVAAGASIADINLVAADLANVDTVAGKIEDVSAIAGRLVDLLAAPGQIDTKRDAALKAIASAQESAVQTVQNTAATETSKAQTAIAGVTSSGVSAVNEAKSDALAKIDATVTQAKSDIQAQVTVATTQATTAAQAATTSMQKATEADQSAKAAEASKAAAETAKASAETSAATATEQAGIATEKAEALTEAMGSLTTLSNDAVRFTAQEKTNAEKYQARKNIAASSAGEVEALKKQVANLQAQAEGKTFTYETDATEAYSKDVPDGAYPYAAVKSFGGKTIVWNQQIPNERISFSQTNASSIQEGPFAYWQMEISTQPVKGHQYYIYFNAVGTTDNFKAARVFYGSTNSVQSGNGKVITAEGSLNLFRCICTGNVGDEVGCSVSNLNIVDLTQMFGAGNEPTKEEFETMFSEDYYEYNAGELKSAPVNNLNIIGTNFIDFSKRYNKGSCDFSDGVLSNKTVDTGTTTFVQVQGRVGYENPEILYSTPVFKAGQHYSCPFVLKHGQALRVKFNGATRDIVFLDSIILPNQYRSFVFSFDVVSANPSVVGGVKIKNLMLTKGTSEKSYSPYKEESCAIPQAVLDLEGYGWSAGTAKNWVDWEKKEYHREVGAADLGDFSWDYRSFSTTNIFWQTGNFLTNVASLGNNCICAKYKTTDMAGLTEDKTITRPTQYWDMNFRVNIADSSFTDPVAFKESLKGTLLYYELAEPEIIDISNILPDDNILEVEEGGTITFENSNGDGFRIPVPFEIVYQKKVTTNE